MVINKSLINKTWFKDNNKDLYDMFLQRKRFCAYFGHGIDLRQSPLGPKTSNNGHAASLNSLDPHRA